MQNEKRVSKLLISCNWITSTENRLYIGWFGVLMIPTLLTAMHLHVFIDVAFRPEDRELTIETLDYLDSLVVVWESVTFESLRLSCSDKLIVIYFDTLRSFFSGAGDPIPYLFCLGSRSEPSSKEDDFVSRFGI
jgi:hypothetical protein